MKFKLIICLYSFFSAFNNNCMNIDNAMDAVRTGNMQVVLQFLNEGHDVNEVDSSEGYTLLHQAVLSEELDISEMLIQRGAKVNSGNSENEAPLHMAAMLGNMKIIQLLLRNGADPNIADDSGKTPLHFSINYQNTIESVKLLLEHRADPRIRDLKGKKPADHYILDQTIKNLLEDAEKQIASSKSKD